MKIPNTGSCFFFFFFFFTILHGTAAAGSGFPGIQLPDIPSSEKRGGFFIFGDSYVDTGNNNYINTTGDFQANYPPYGESFFPSPTGRYSDGRVIPDFLAEYANLPFIQPYLDPKNDFYLNGVNFASGGAGALAETRQGKVLGLQTQMKFFKEVDKSLSKKLGKARTQRFFSKSVFLFNFGGSDYLNAYDIFKTLDGREQFANMVIGNLTIALEEVYKYGGRKFAFMAVPPMCYSPSSRWQRSAQLFEETSSLARLHNTMFPSAIQKLATQLHGFKYAFADSHTLHLQRILNPTKYGFKIVDTACCGSDVFRGFFNCGRKTGPLPFTLCENVQDYMYFDSYHPTEKTYEQLAQQMWSGGPEIVKPYNFKQLFQYERQFIGRF